MNTEMIYESLKQQDKTLSRSRFSREYLGRDRNYWFVCKNRGIDISDSALLRLYGELKGTSRTWKQIAESESTKAESVYNQRYEFTKSLAETAFAEIERRAMVLN